MSAKDIVQHNVRNGKNLTLKTLEGEELRKVVKEQQGKMMMVH